MLTEYLNKLKKHINSLSEEEFDKILKECGIEDTKPSEESDYVKALIDNRPQCCIDHDVYMLTCDICEYGLGD